MSKLESATLRSTGNILGLVNNCVTTLGIPTRASAKLGSKQQDLARPGHMSRISKIEITAQKLNASTL